MSDYFNRNPFADKPASPEATEKPNPKPSYTDYTLEAMKPVPQGGTDYFSLAKQMGDAMGEERRANLKAFDYMTPVSDTEYKIIRNRLLQVKDQGGDFQGEAYKLATAVEMSRYFGRSMLDTINSFDATYSAWTGREFRPDTTHFRAIADSFTLGSLNIDMGKVARAWMDGGGQDEALEKQLDALSQQIEKYKDYAPRPWIVEALKAGAESAPFTLRAMGAGALAAGGVVLALGTTGLAAPATLGLLKAGASMLGSFSESADTMRGLEYYEMRKAGIDHETAQASANLSGSLQGAVESLLGNVPGIAGAGIAAKVSSRLAIKGGFSAVARAAAGYVGEAIEEGLEEGIQQIISDTIQNEAKEQFGVDIKDADQIAKDAWESAKGGFTASLVMGLPSSVVGGIKTAKTAAALKEYAKTTDRETFVENAGKWEDLEALSDEDKKATLSKVWEQAQKKAKEERTKAAEGTRKPFARTEAGTLYTEETTVGSAEEGKVEAILKVGDADSKERLGYLKYEVTDDSIVITNAPFKKGYEHLREEAVLELAAKYPNLDIKLAEGAPESIRGAVESLEGANPRGTGANWYKDQDPDTARARARLRLVISEKMPKVSPVQREAAILLHEFRANAQGVGFADYLKNEFSPEIIGTDTSRVSAAQGQRAGILFTKDGQELNIGEFVRDAQALVMVTEKSDFVSFVHESGHLFRKQLIDTDLGKKLDEAYEIVGGQWTREHEERFVDDLVKYLSYGEAKDERLKSVFQKIAEWITRLWQKVLGQADVDPRVRAVMDELFKSEKSPLSEAARTEAIAEEAEASERGKAVQLEGKDEVLFQPAPPEDSEAFKKWFGDSKVVDAEGKPLVVYHGSPDLRWLKENGIFKSEKERYGMGRDTHAHWFTPSLSTAKTYANPQRAFDYQNAEEGVVACYIKLENPLVINANGKEWRNAQKVGKTSDVMEQARAGGHDGVIIHNVKDDYNNNSQTRPTDTYVVFSPEQIKSVNNRGTWDADDPRILFQTSAPTEKAQKVFDAVIDYQGVTDDINEAGFVLPDGRMVDLSGRVEDSDYKKAGDRLKINGVDYLKGKRLQAHSDVRWEGSPQGARGYLVRQGAVRIDAKFGIIELDNAPTYEQATILRRLYDGKEIAIEAHDKGRTADIRTDDPKRAMGLLRRFYDGEDVGSVLFQYVGEKAELDETERQNLSIAKEMAQSEKDAETVRLATGWFKGKYDGKWRLEISDKAAVHVYEDRIMPGKAVPLAEVLQYPALYAKYPDLKDIPVSMLPEHTTADSVAAIGEGKSGEEYLLVTPERAGNQWELSKIVLHEVQHLIQKREGFARGSSPFEFEYDDRKAQAYRYYRDASVLQTMKARTGSVEEAVKQFKTRLGRDPEPGASTILDDYTKEDLVQLAEDSRPRTLMEQYTNTAGEIEARDIEARMGLSAEQRRATAPYSSENIAAEDAVVLFQTVPREYSIDPAEAAPEDFISEGDFDRKVNGHYYENHELSSRTTPAGEFSLKEGTWIVADYKLMDGHPIGQLRLMDVQDIRPTEDLVPTNTQGRGWDSERYAEWMREGKTPPPITVLEMEDGEYTVSDGHRRYYAAKATTGRVWAWVWPMMENPRHPDMKTAMTYEAKTGKEWVKPETVLFQTEEVDEATGLRLNSDGSVTVYHGTTREAAQEIIRTGRLKSAGEPDVYVTSDPRGGAYAEGEAGYGDGTVVALHVDPTQLELDDEFPDGRKDFRINTGRPGGAVRVRVAMDESTLFQLDEDAIDAEAATFDSWQEWKEYVEGYAIPAFGEDARAPEGVQGEVADGWYAARWEAAHSKAEKEKSKAREKERKEARRGEFAEQMAKPGAVEKLLSAIWDAQVQAYDTAQATDEQEQQEIEQAYEWKKDLEQRLGDHPLVLLAAQSIANGKSLKPSTRKAILTYIRHNEIEFAALYAELTGDLDLAQYAEAGRKRLHEIPDPKLEKYADMSIAERTALLNRITDQDVKAKLKDGSIDGPDLLDYIRRLEESKKSLEKEAKENAEEIEKLGVRVDDESYFARKMHEKATGLKKEIESRDKELSKLKEQKARIETAKQAYTDALKSAKEESALSVKIAKKTYVDALQSAQKEARLQTRLVAAEIRATEKLRQQRDSLRRAILKRPSKNIIWEKRQGILTIQEYLRSKKWEYIEEIEEDGKKRRRRAYDTVLGPDGKTHKVPRYTSVQAENLGAALSLLLRESPHLGKLLTNDIVDRINDKPVSAWTVAELTELKKILDTMAKEGRMAYSAKIAQEEYERTEGQNEVNATVRKSKYFKAPFGHGSVEQKELLKNMDKRRVLDLPFLNMRRFASVYMDGGSDGANVKLLVDEERDRYGAKVYQIDRRLGKVFSRMQELKLGEKDFQEKVTIEGVGPGQTDYTVSIGDLMAIRLALKDSDAKVAFIYGNLFSEEERRTWNAETLHAQGNAKLQKVSRAIDELPPAMKEIADLIGEDFDKEFDRLNKAVIELTNQEMKKVVHYFPIHREGAYFDKFGDSILEELKIKYGMINLPDSGFTLERIKIGASHQTPIKLDLFGTWQKAVERQEHLVSYGSYLKKLNAVYKSRKAGSVREAIIQSFGKAGMDYVDQYISEIANPHEFKGPEEGDRAVRFLRGNMAVGFLAYRWTSVVKQIITSPLPYMAYAPKGMSAAAFQCLKSGNPMQWLTEIESMSQMLKHRTADQIFETIRNMDREGFEGVVKKIGSVGMKGLEMADRFSVAIGWKGVYDEALAKGMTEEEAVKKADDITAKTQPSARGVDLAPVFRGNNEWKRLLLQFGSALNVIYQNIRYDMPQAWREKEFGRAIAIGVSYSIAGVLLGAFTKAIGRDKPEDDEAWYRDWIYYSMTQFTDSVPLIGNELTGFMKRWIAGDKRRFGDSELLPAVEALLSGADNLLEGDILKALEEIGTGLGLGIGLPTLALKEYIEFLINLLGGEGE